MTRIVRMVVIVEVADSEAKTDEEAVEFAKSCCTAPDTVPPIATVTVIDTEMVVITEN